MTRAVEVVSASELRTRRQRLLKRARTDWADLRRRADDYALTDDERGIYDSIRSIDWMLSRNR